MLYSASWIGGTYEVTRGGSVGWWGWLWSSEGSEWAMNVYFSNFHGGIPQGDCFDASFYLFTLLLWMKYILFCQLLSQAVRGKGHPAGSGRSGHGHELAFIWDACATCGHHIRKHCKYLNYCHGTLGHLAWKNCESQVSLNQLKFYKQEIFMNEVTE